ncbi:MAG: OmpA family protein [Candidatus Kapabacteria bacterium]|nr:OmpA family protein [Ignavibacteriota bacterium]MCW5884147.1 OmpA family protein [Candidatus Kapabacteria bacterium]
MRLITTLFILTSFGFSSAFSQFGLGERLKRKVEEKIERKTEEAVERALEKPFEEREESDEDSNGTNSPQDSGSSNSGRNSSSSDNSVKPEVASLKTYSKFDFIPGENVVFFEDFSQDAVGDFPVNWNTNGSGEIITTSLNEGKWLKMVNEALYVPDIKHPFPENFTLEFDLLCNFNEEVSSNHLGYLRLEIMQIDNVRNSIKTDYLSTSENLFNHIFEMDLQFLYESRIWIKNMVGWEDGGINNQLVGNWIKGQHRKPIHFSISVNKQRYRLWINEAKVVDIPRLVDKDAKNNLIRIFPYSLNMEYDFDLMISNIKFAEGTVDARSKLITEGRLVTHGITFDTGSDKIKPESFAVIKSIADVLAANADVKIMIVGHTDSDGNADKNQTLSEKRAAAVKNSLVGEFGIQESRIQTSGKGDKVPVAENNSTQGKAQNRRVEFVKI